MKKIILSALLLTTATTMAKPNAQKQMNEQDHKAILALLLGKHAPASFSEERSYYFADMNDKGFVQIENNAQGVSFSIVEEHNNMGMGVGFSPGYQTQTSYSKNNDGTVSLFGASYVEQDGQNLKYFSTGINLEVSEIKNNLYYQVQAEETQFLSYKSLENPAVYKYIVLQKPEVKKEEGSAELVLSLTPAEITKMGKMAARKMKEKRAPDGNECSLKTRYTLECKWSLETDYAADTLRGVFSVKDGKVRELLDTSIEPGC